MPGFELACERAGHVVDLDPPQDDFLYAYGHSDPSCKAKNKDFHFVTLEWLLRAGRAASAYAYLYRRA